MSYVVALDIKKELEWSGRLPNCESESMPGHTVYSTDEKGKKKGTKKKAVYEIRKYADDGSDGRTLGFCCEDCKDYYLSIYK